MRQVKQYRYNMGNKDNITPADGKIIIPENKICALTVQAYPGTKLWINGNINNPIIIGPYGLYELKINAGMFINCLEITNYGTLPLIVDCVIEGSAS